MSLIYRKIHSPLKIDNSPNVKPQVQIFEYIMRNFEAIIGSASKFEGKFAGDKGYSAVRDFLSNSSSVLYMNSPQSASSVKDNSSTEKNNKSNRQYGKYGRLYQKYNELSHMTKSKIKEIYRNVIEQAFRKLRNIYQGGNNNQNGKKEPYNPFRKSSLAGRVVQLSSYPLIKRAVYLISKRPEYIRTVQNTYNRNQEVSGLEALLKVA